MIKIIGDNIISPLGVTTSENLAAVREGKSALAEHHYDRLPEAFVASLLKARMGFEDGLTSSIKSALEDAAGRGYVIDAAAEDVIFIISSTKGNVDMLEAADDGKDPVADVRIGHSAQTVASRFGNTNRPVVVSNACISGLAAQITAMRLLRMGRYRTAIVSGYDIQSRFIVSGFQSFKALSPEVCRPFDGDRCGLNLGEAVATMILQSDDAGNDAWILNEGAVNNDANHISNPSRTAEGSYRAIRYALNDACPMKSPASAEDMPLASVAETLACISAHGTATLFNDEMEAAAISRAGLADVPAFSLKAYYGHTMGAAGLLESIITLHATDEGWVPATRNFAELGTSKPINVIPAITPVGQGADGQKKTRVLKMLSGFGGCNAAMLYGKASDSSMTGQKQDVMMRQTDSVVLSSGNIGQTLTELYKAKVGDYPKFYKMDPLCKLGFLASEMLLNAEAIRTGTERFVPREDRAVVICTRSGSLADDRAYLETIKDENEFYPSPAVFVYTLSNIVTGELAIRNHLFGETSCFIIEEKDQAVMDDLIKTAFMDQRIKSVIGGWLEYGNDHDFEADLAIYERN